MFKHQPPKALAIIPILVLCFITFLWSRDRTALLHTPDLGEPAVILPYSPPDIKLALDGNAHRLLSPDLFLPHFKAVTQMHGMKIAEAKAGCKWSEAEQVDFQFNTDIDWVIRDRSDVEINMRRREWQDFISNDLLPYETYKHRFEGRGIVIVAGQSRSLKASQCHSESSSTTWKSAANRITLLGRRNDRRVKAEDLISMAHDILQ